MGFGRFIFKTVVPGGHLISTIKNVVDEGNIVDGVKKTYKQYVQEDIPGISHIYQSGKKDGKVEGYAEASDEYEKKLISQAELFLKQKQIFEQERDEYESLLDEYEKEIDRLEKVEKLSSDDTLYLQKLLSYDRKLRKLEWI